MSREGACPNNPNGHNFTWNTGRTERVCSCGRTMPT